MTLQITPEPDEAERKAILEALAAEEAELRAKRSQPVTEGLCGAFLPHVGGVHPL
jgi:hypothetical protein